MESYSVREGMPIKQMGYGIGIQDQEGLLLDQQAVSTTWGHTLEAADTQGAVRTDSASS